MISAWSWGLYAGTRGWWELDRDLDAVAFIEDVVRSVIAGRVYEVLGPARSRLVVTLSDGSHAYDTGYDAPLGLLPLPLYQSTFPDRTAAQGLAAARPFRASVSLMSRRI